MTTAKWTGGVAEGVEGLLCKFKALSPNSSPTKRKERERERERKCVIPLHSKNILCKLKF
jgi:hypothetical protein